MKSCPQCGGTFYCDENPFQEHVMACRKQAAMKTPDLLESIISLLRQHGPMDANQLQRWLESQGQSVTLAALASTMMAEEARDARIRRLRKATGYPPGYYISFDNNAGRD